MFGAPHPGFCTLELHLHCLQATTHVFGGEDPFVRISSSFGAAQGRWGEGSANSLEVELNAGEKTVAVQVWNANWVLDDLVAEAELEVAQFPADGEEHTFHLQLRPSGVLTCIVMVIDDISVLSVSPACGVPLNLVLCCHIHSVAGVDCTPFVSATMLPKLKQNNKLKATYALTECAEELEEQTAYFGEGNMLVLAPADEGTADLLLQVKEQGVLLQDRMLGALMVDMNFCRLRQWQRYRIELASGQQVLERHCSGS